jgi:hypothetical protein
MASLLFTCPKTNLQTPTGIETDVKSLSAAWKATLKVACPRSPQASGVIPNGIKFLNCSLACVEK